MNKQRRSQLKRAIPLLAEAVARLAEARAVVSDVRDDEAEAHERLSDGQRDGDLGDEMQAALDALAEILDTIDATAIGVIARGLAEIADAEEPCPGNAALSGEELEERRLARMPPWIKERLATAARETETARRDLADAFADPDETDRTRIVVDDYDSPVQDRTIPARSVAFPGAGMRVTATRDGRAIEVSSREIGRIVVLPVASNTVQIRTERHFA